VLGRRAGADHRNAGDVESARVHLVMPTDSVFLDRQHTAKASVILKLRATVFPRMRSSPSRVWYPERWMS
jgi:hypothetical protein